MRNILTLSAICMMLIAVSVASDPRIAFAIPYLTPDSSLKTTDPMYLGMMGGLSTTITPTPNYQLPPIFGGPSPVVIEDNWMKTETRPKHMNSSNQTIVLRNSYEMPIDLLNKYVPAGKESWL